MKAYNTIMHGLWISGLGLAGIVLASFLVRTPAPAPPDPPRATGANVTLRVEAEFSLHGQDCVVVGVFVNNGNQWERLHRFTDCGHGITPGSMRPGGPDGGSYNDGWWDDRLGSR